MMSGLFDDEDAKQARLASPLAERMRPQKLSDVVGQEHLLGANAPLTAFVERGSIPSLILWGQPGTGKTTIAALLATSVGAVFERISAIESGVKELRELIAAARGRLRSGLRTVLFIDEVHRFNKSQQDALLHAVETGVLTMIGATTENPSFEVNSALLSRCQVYKLSSLSEDAVRSIVERAINEDDQLHGIQTATIDWPTLIALSGGDARAALNLVEAASTLTQERPLILSKEVLQTVAQRKTMRHDKAGDSHYDTISAFIKTIRGSDPDAALVYLALMIEGGEDALFIARRLIVLASEDIGNAEPRALEVAVNTFLAVERIGMPEGRLALAQCTTFLASAPKSNASYVAYEKAASAIREQGSITIPLHIRNAPTQLMKQQGYGAGYVYPHDEEVGFVHTSYFPEEMDPQAYYEPTTRGEEMEIRKRLRSLWPERYDANPSQE